MFTNATAQSPVEQSSFKTQTATIKAHLLTGASITSFDAYRLYNITTLAQRIYEIRNSGLVIQSEQVYKQQFHVYWLDEATLIEALRHDEVNANEPV